MENFIEEIKNVPELYNKKHPKYLFNNQKEKIWANLTIKYGFDAKTKWTRLRDYYSKIKRLRNLPSGSASTKEREWAYFEHMKFIDTYLKPRRLRENEDQDSALTKIDDFSEITSVDENVYSSEKSSV